MATTDRRTAASTPTPNDIADALRAAELAHVIAYPDGDGLAAAGLLAAACRATGVPYHVTAARTADDLARRLAGADATATALVVGVPSGDGLAVDPDGPVSPVAFEAAAALGADPEAATALAGVVAAGGVPSRATPDLLESAGLERVPGVAVPTADLADGLAHTGLVHAPFSGDVDAAGAALGDLGLEAGSATPRPEQSARRVASMLALAATDSPQSTTRAAMAVERALRPYPIDGPFATLAGYADVLSALAERAPGLAVAVAVGEGGRTAALEAWRDHGRAAHAAVRDAGTARHRGLLVARTDGPVAAVARLVRDFRSPEPVVLAVGAGEAAAASVESPVARPLEAAAAAAGGSSLARDTEGRATFDPDRTEAFVDAFREAAP